MTRTLKHFCLVCTFLAAFLVPALATAEDSCKDVLVYAARNYMSRFSMDERKAWVYAQKCGGTASSTNAGMDMLVEAVPIGVSLSRSNQRQWCEENKRLDTYRSVAESIDSTVSIPAVQSWASCMEVYSRGLVTRIRVTPDEETIQLLLTNETANQEQLTGVFVHSRENDGITCSPSPQPGSPDDLRLNREFLVNCARSAVDVVRNGNHYQVLPGGSITAITTLGSYLYSFPERFVEVVTPSVAPQRQALSLNGMHVGTKAYWAGGAASQLISCARIEPPAPNFELIEIGTREERVRGLGNPRGICGTPPYCDSAGEYCAEVYYTKACFINREWHEWYRAQSLSNNIPYSAESVCGT